MKWQWKSLWVVIICLVVLGVWIMSFPFTDQGLSSASMKDGRLDLSAYNFAINGPVNVDGLIGFIHKEIVYDDEYFEDKLDLIEYVPVGFLDEVKYDGKTYGTFIFEFVPPRTMDMIAFELPDISSSYKMWIDGKLVSSLGRVAPSQTQYEPMTLTKRVIFPVDNKPVTILFQVANYSNHHTGFQDKMIIGSAEQIMQRQINSTLREYLIITSALLIGVYHIAISAMRIDDMASLHFGLFSIFLALTLTFFGEKSVYKVFPWLEWAPRLQLGLLFSLVTFLLMMRYIILLRENGRDTKLEMVIQLVLIFTYIGMALSQGELSQTLWISVYLTSILGIAVYMLVQMIAQLRKKEAGMGVAVIGVFATLVIFLLDVSDLYSEKYSSYGLFIFIFSQALALGFRYSESFRKNVELTSELRLNAKILEERNTEVELAKDKLVVLNKELDDKVNERTEDIRLLLDHSGQAFLSINEKSQIQPGFSKLTQVFLGEKIRGLDLWSLICDEENENKDLVRRSVTRALNEFSPLRRTSYLEILPREIHFNGYDLSVEYKCVKTSFKEQIMVIMTDITSEKTLREQLNLEAEQKWTTLKIITNSNEFWSLYDTFESFVTKTAHEQVRSTEDMKELKDKLIKTLHYYKGSFSIYGLEDVVRSIHKMETELADLTVRTKKSIKSVFSKTDSIVKLETVISKIRENEGVDLYTYREAVMIPKEKLHDVSKTLKRQFGNTAGEMIQEVYTLKHKPFRGLFDPYIDYVSILGKNVGKEINPLQISGGNFLIDPHVYEGFSRSMVHLFRNIVDHGIEKPELRHERGKTSAGNIELEISVSKRNKQPIIHMEIRDDGGGINESKLKDVIHENTDLQPSAINDLNRNDLLRYIFSPNVSTKENGDIVSGRGMGMTIVLEEISELGGQIDIKNEEQMGLNFIIEMPYKF